MKKILWVLETPKPFGPAANGMHILDAILLSKIVDNFNNTTCSYLVLASSKRIQSLMCVP